MNYDSIQYENIKRECFLFVFDFASYSLEPLNLVLEWILIFCFSYIPIILVYIMFCFSITFTALSNINNYDKLNSNIFSNYSHPQYGNIHSGATVLQAMPYYHMYGTGQLLACILYGCKLVEMRKFHSDAFVKYLQEYKVNILYLVPPLIQFLATSDKITKKHLANMRMILCGGAPLSRETQLLLYERWAFFFLLSDVRNVFLLFRLSADIFKQAYGLTETSLFVATMIPWAKSKLGSVGLVTLNNTIKISDLKTGETLGPKEMGEICIKGSNVFKGYLKNLQATEDVFDSQGYFHSGDVGYYDEDGFIFIKDRVKELIKYNAFQVFLRHQ